MEMNTIMTPEMAMRFMIWSYYYHGVVPQAGVSYATCGKFAPCDVERLDGLRDMLLLTFQEESVRNACRQFQMARECGENCPYTQEELDLMFVREVAHMG